MTFPHALRLPRSRSLVERSTVLKLAIAAVATLLAAGLALLLVGMRTDLAAIRADTDVQRRTIAQTLEVIQTQAQLLRRAVTLQEELLAASRTGVQLTQDIRADSNAIRADVERTSRAAEQIRRDVHELNQRSGGSVDDRVDP